MKRPQDTVPKPGFEIPNLTEQQQEVTGLPADFWTAFDEYFGEFDADEDREMLAESLGLDADLMHPDDPRSDDLPCYWRVCEDDGPNKQVRLQLMGVYGLGVGEEVLTHIWLQDRSLVKVARRLVRDADQRRFDLERIRRGEAAVWSFLPPTRDQADALKSVYGRERKELKQVEQNRHLIEINATFADFVGMSSAEIEEHFVQLGLPDDLADQLADGVHAGSMRFEHAGGATGIGTLRSRAAQLRQEIDDIEYMQGWPGRGRPPKEEQ